MSNIFKSELITYIHYSLQNQQTNHFILQLSMKHSLTLFVCLAFLSIISYNQVSAGTCNCTILSYYAYASAWTYAGQISGVIIKYDTPIDTPTLTGYNAETGAFVVPANGTYEFAGRLTLNVDNGGSYRFFFLYSINKEVPNIVMRHIPLATNGVFLDSWYSGPVPLNQGDIVAGYFNGGNALPQGVLMPGMDTCIRITKIA